MTSRAGQSGRQGENLPERDSNAEPAAIACDSDRPDNPAPRPAGTGDTPTLTAEERLAIREAADAYEENNEDADCERIAHTLRGLLDRTSDGGNLQ